VQTKNKFENIRKNKIDKEHKILICINNTFLLNCKRKSKRVNIGDNNKTLQVGYLDTWIPQNLDTWIPVYLDTWIPGYLDTWIPG